MRGALSTRPRKGDGVAFMRWLVHPVCSRGEVRGHRVSLRGAPGSTGPGSRGGVWVSSVWSCRGWSRAPGDGRKSEHPGPGGGERSCPGAGAFDAELSPAAATMAVSRKRRPRRSRGSGRPARKWARHTASGSGCGNGVRASCARPDGIGDRPPGRLIHALDRFAVRLLHHHGQREVCARRPAHVDHLAGEAGRVRTHGGGDASRALWRGPRSAGSRLPCQNMTNPCAAGWPQ